MQKISALIFDFGNVLTMPQNKLAMRKMAELIATRTSDKSALDPQEFLLRYQAPRHDYDRGTIDAYEYFNRICQSYGFSFDKEKDADFFRALKSCDITCWYTLNPAMMEYVNQLRPRVKKIALLSNINFEGVAEIKRYNWFENFDAHILSCEHGILKPEPAIYKLCLEKIQTEPSEAIFFDDLLPNIEGAWACGLNAHIYTTIDSFKNILENHYQLVK